MDIVLEKIHYNPDFFLKIVEDFEYYVKHTKLGVYQKTFGDIKISLLTVEDPHLICFKIATKNMERAPNS